MFNLFIVDKLKVYLILYAENTIADNKFNSVINSIQTKFSEDIKEPPKVLLYNEKLKIFSYSISDYLSSLPNS